MSNRAVPREGSQNSFYIVSLNIRGRPCTVVGGGPVALRKVQALLEHGASVRVISPKFCTQLDRMAHAGVISAIVKEYAPADLKGSWLVIAATDNAALNSAVGEDARRKHIIANIVDNAALSDFIVPSCLSRGNLTIAVSTGGASPALARRIRLMLECIVGDEYAALVQLAAEVREYLRRRDIKVDGARWQEALDVNTLVELLRQGKRKQARSLLVKKLIAVNTK